MSGSSDPALTPMRIGSPRSFASRGDGLDVFGLADVAGVEPQPLDAGLDRGERELVLEVDVGDDRHRRARDDLRQPLGRGFLVAGAAHDVAARRRRARRSGRACRRRRRSWWWSSTAPRSGRRHRRRPCPTWTWRVTRRCMGQPTAAAWLTPRVCRVRRMSVVHRRQGLRRRGTPREAHARGRWRCGMSLRKSTRTVAVLDLGRDPS